MLKLRLRWALRDARKHWVPVVAIALMIAIGTGLYAGLSSLTQWRLDSNDASLALGNMHDLRARLGGGFLPQGALADIARSIDGVADADERLIAATQADVPSPGGEAVFVPARLIGVDMSGGGPSVDRVLAYAGRGIEESEIGQPAVMLERNFAVFYGLPDSGELTLGGGTAARYVGHAVSPEYYLVVEEGSFVAQANLAVVFTSLATAQEITGRPGLVNDLVLTVEPGADLAAVEDALVSAVEARHAGVGLSLTRREDDPSYRALTQDPEGDQQFYNLFALAIFAGAAFAALNLAARMAEAQRREIGVQMALGVRPLAIVIRPLLFGAQVAVLGVVFGIGAGLLVGAAMGAVLEQFVPLPVFETPFQAGIFARAAIIGLIVPVAAVLWPVYRAVRVAPVEAIRTGHLAARGGGFAPLLGRLPLPGGAMARMPLRNLMRAPRRMLLTLLGLTAVLAVLFNLVVMIDSFVSTVERGETELLGDAPDRLVVELDDFYPVDAPEVAGLAASGLLRVAEPEVRLYGTAEKGGASVPVQLQFVDFESPLWRPTAVEGALTVDRPGVVLARKAAQDLGAGPGDRVTLRLPVRTGSGAFTFESSEAEVLAVHPHTLRLFAYADVRHAGLAGLDGYANVLSGAPEDGQTLSSIKRALFSAPSVGAVRGVAEASQATRESIEQFAGVFLVMQAFVLGLALLMAFNTANINSEERARDHATMFAFGVRVRGVLGVMVAEGLILGVLAAVLGAVGGYGMTLWVLRVLLPRSYPDLWVPPAFDALSVALTMAAAVVVIGIAPVLTVRKLRRMNVPATLRVME